MVSVLMPVFTLLQQVLMLPHHTSKAELEISLRRWDVQFCGICAALEGKLVVFRVARITLCSPALLRASRALRKMFSVEHLIYP